jgi:hypothetical protein
MTSQQAMIPGENDRGTQLDDAVDGPVIREWYEARLRVTDIPSEKRGSRAS